LLVGVVFGTYSSVYVASALALDTQLWLEGQARKK
jgi:preprotein translocase subunit SecF